MEIYNDWLSSKMTRAELNELTVEDMKERRRLQKVKENIKYYKNNRDRKIEYNQSTNGKKSSALTRWKKHGLHETQEELDRIYELYLNQELCNACDVKLTRNGDNDPTQAVLDHDHDTNRFRHIICRSCNCNDNWKKYFC